MTLTLFTAGVLAIAAVLTPNSASAAQVSSAAMTTDLSAEPAQKKKTTVAPRVAPRGPRVAPRAVGPRVAPRAVGPRVAPRTVGPRVGTPRTGSPRLVTPTGARVVTTSRLRGLPMRGAGRAVIRGQNYSVWRSDYRIRRGGGWRTFVALGALGAIAIGAVTYYPYAYIETPQPYCEGLTDDGCQLMWQEVETIEGGVEPQCVAFCPWQ